MLAGDLLGERARLTPSKTALVCVESGARYSYGELDRRATLAARALREGLGLARGERVGLLSGNRVEFLDLFFGVAKAGLVLVPLGTRLTPHEIGHVVADSGLRVLAYSAEHAETARAVLAAASQVRGLALDAGDLAALEQALSPSEWRAEPASPEDLWALLYTSGTTGKPKGVRVPHRMVLWNGYNTAVSWQLREDDVSPIFTPLYHAGGLGAFLVPIFTIGGTIVLHAGFDAAEIWRTIEAERCTVVLGVPTIWKLLLEAPEFAGTDLSHVRFLISGGAPLPVYLIEAYQRRGVVFKQGYGLTEVGVNCFAMTVEESAPQARLDRQAAHVHARRACWTRAAARSRPARWASCACAATTSARATGTSPRPPPPPSTPEGFFHTGDLARRDDEGFFYIAGRRKDMLISGGVNVYPAEIEGELLQHPDVRDAAVVGVPHPTWGEVGVAFVVPGARRPTGDELQAFLLERLAKYKLPRDFVFLETLPRTAYGKVVKGELRERWLAAQGDGTTEAQRPQREER